MQSGSIVAPRTRAGSLGRAGAKDCESWAQVSQPRSGWPACNCPWIHPFRPCDEHVALDRMLVRKHRRTVRCPHAGFVVPHSRHVGARRDHTPRGSDEETKAAPPSTCSTRSW